MAYITGKIWRKIPCPNCGKRGLHYAVHPHAYGYKDYDRCSCRFCHISFKIQDDEAIVRKYGDKNET